MLECKEWEQNWFLTLTYNEENVVYNAIVNTETGEVGEVKTLVPEHLTKFMKDLRRYFEYHFGHTGIRFYACGEYGDKTQRPHFHLIVFNLPLNDLVQWKSVNGNPYFLSETILKIWEKGHITVCNVNWETCAYVARYIMKKWKGEGAKEFYEIKGIEPEFVRMSRNPGIGKKYFETNKEEIYKNDEIIAIGANGKAQKIKPPKYFDRLFDIESPEDMEKIRKKREKLARERNRIEMKGTSLEKEEYLKAKEDIKKAKTKALIRPLE